MGRPKKATTARSNSTTAATHSHFFRIIIDDTIKEKKLKLPHMFVKIYGKQLSNVATLSVPHQGGVWRIGLAKEGSNVWFCDYWHRFVQYYSISSGDFLVFRYENNSKFHVLMFDHSTCEIRYPSCNGVGQLARDHIHGIESKDNVKTRSSRTSKHVVTSLKSKPLKDLSRKRSSASLEESKSKNGNNRKHSKKLKIEESNESRQGKAK